MTPRDALEIVLLAVREDGWNTPRRQAAAILDAAVAVATNHAQATAPPPRGTSPLFRGPSDVAEADQRRTAQKRRAREQRDIDAARLRDISDV